MERISTGISNIDRQLQGGYPEGEAILVTGEPGTGKTIFAIQFLYNACMEGKRCVMIATEETPEKILIHSKILGIDLEPYTDEHQLSIIRLLEMRAANYGGTVGAEGDRFLHVNDLDNLAHLIADDVEAVVVDNIGTFSIRMELQQFRDRLETLIYTLSMKKRTSLLIIDATAHKLTHNIAEYSTYGTVKLLIKENPYTGNMERFMYIPKMRDTKLSLEPIPYDITGKGIRTLGPKNKN